MSNDVFIDTLTSNDVVEIVKCGGNVFEVSEGFFYHSLEYKILMQNLLLTCLKKDLFKPHGKNLLQNRAKKIRFLVYGGNIRRDTNEDYKCVTEN